MTAPAYLADGQPVSREAFYARACDPQRSAVVEACAGAGKTWMLVSRILRALLAGAQPHEILAITFTRKAAGEMRQRLTDWLREFASPSTSAEARFQALVERGVAPHEAPALVPALQSLHEQVLSSGRAVEIRTFHAWFAQLMRTAPLELLAELGLQGDMDLIEDLDDHRAELMRLFHAVILRNPGLRADHARLIAQRGRSQANKWFEAVLDKRVEFELADVAGVLENSVEPASQRWPELAGLAHPAQALQAEAWRAELRELLLELGLGGAKAQEATTGLVMALGEEDPQAMFSRAWEALFTQKGTPRKQLGKSTRLPAMQDQLAKIGEQVRQHDAHVEHARMVRLSRVLLAEFAAYKRARGLADMADLERCALALLRDATLSGWVQERLDARIRHVLIDEFQDTSPLQWHALHAWLSAYAGAGGGASGQRSPAIFIVGDPKQSIYRFRRAEPRVFEAARHFVRQAMDGTVLACDHTRRNAPEVLQLLNTVFGQAEHAGEFSGFRAHTTEVAAHGAAAVFALPVVARPPRVERGEPADELESWRDSLTTPRDEPEEVLRAQEAALVANAIADLVARQQTRLGDIFVLCRKRESLRLVAQALRNVHLASATVEDRDLMQAPEARDLLAVLEVLASTGHRLSLAHALRSPLFGASDDDLTALAERAGAERDWWHALVATHHTSAALQRAQSLMQVWHADAQRLPPHDLLDRIVHQGELRERVVASVPPEQRLAALDAIDAVLAQALVLDGARYATPYNFVRALKRRTIKVAAPAQQGVVQLLTVHGAKGLEASTVFVMDTDPEPKNAETATLLIDWPVESEHPRRCAFLYSESSCPPSLVDAMAQEQAARQREELNGLYVALSRAKDRLVFSATAPRRGASGSASWWQRVEAQAQVWKVPPLPADGSGSRTEPVVLKALPERGQISAGSAFAGGVRTAAAPDTDATRLGKAVHRTLEWATARPGSPVADAASLAHAAAREFNAPAEEVARLALRILRSPACARFFDDPRLRWAGNEVAVSDGAQVLRVDRLVLVEEERACVWWVLDYKLAHAPQELTSYRDQLRRYRSAVVRSQPGALVRCAFITGEGEVVEVAAQ